jgi:hypothetical protein
MNLAGNLFIGAQEVPASTGTMKALNPASAEVGKGHRQYACDVTHSVNAASATESARSPFAAGRGCLSAI